MSLTKIVTYDLLGSNQHYSNFMKAIQGYNNVQITSSCYVVETDDSPQEIRNKLFVFMGQNDRIFVSNLRTGSVGTNIIGNPQKFMDMKKE
ncbi:hypothetical protein QJ133_01935 [Priestia megaterium]|jgi:hypothetical protein|uniref:hypothetical protein n=1 Tax=Priestia megaterium TaxID=1404 RepID=UPI00249ADE28|nr:hypothetical protein [Priestia megaterium]MDI3089936.1 hypothetical protein [Priestia megaterium]